MNFTRNSFFLLLVILTSSIPSLEGMTTTMYKPSSKLQTPHFAKDQLTSFSAIYSAGNTTQAYNQFGNLCNPLEIYGQDTLSAQLLPPAMIQYFLLSIPADLVNDLGAVNFQGKFGVKELYLHFSKNLIYGFFLEGAALIRDLQISKITMQPNLNPALTPIQAQTVITTLSDALNSNGSLLQPDGGMRKYGLMQSYILAGWSHHFQNFQHIDFLDITFKAGLSLPEQCDQNFNDLFAFPFPGNRHIGFPIIANIGTGFLDWLNVGSTIIVMPWLANMDLYTLNPAGTNTTILVPFQDIATEKTNPFYHTSVYIEADHFFKGFSLRFSYLYTHNGKSTLTPANTARFPTNLVNQSPNLQSWDAKSILSEIEYDFATEESPDLPIIKFFYTIPLAGENIIKTPITGASLGCIFTYEF